MASRALASAESGNLDGLDDLAARLYGLRPQERGLVAEAVLRGRSSFLDTTEARQCDFALPEVERLHDYAASTCRTVNAVLGLACKRYLLAKFAAPRRTKGHPLKAYTAIRLIVRSG